MGSSNRFLSSQKHWYGSFIFLACLVVCWLPQCKPIPVCLDDSDCSPYRCIEQQCIPASELSSESASSEDGKHSHESGSEESPSEPSKDSIEQPQESNEPSTDDSPKDAESTDRDDAGEETPPEQAPEQQATEPSTPPKTWGDFAFCNGTWVLTTEDPKHCGGCGKQCGSGQPCCGGVCGGGKKEVCNGKDDDCDGKIDEDTTSCLANFAGLDLSEEGPAMWAPLSGPMGLTIDKQGDLYIAERNRFRVRKLSPDGILTTLAGSGTYSTEGITVGLKVVPALANFQGPVMLRLDSTESNLKVIQSPHPTVWNIHLAPTQADVRVSGVAFPSAIISLLLLDPKTALYSSFAGSTIYQYNWNTRKPTRYAGGGGPKFSGPRLSVRLGLVVSMERNQKGEVFLIDERHFTIRKITVGGNVEVFAGRGFEGNATGNRSQALFSEMFGLLFDKKGELLVSDSGNDQIKKIDNTGQVFVYAGDSQGYKDGKLRQAKFFDPTGMAQDQQGNTYVSDTGNQRIRKIDSSGNVTTIAGATKFRNGSWHTTQLNEPRGLAFDSKGNLYVADAGNHRIVVFDTQGKSRTFLGSGGQRLLRIRTRYTAPGPQKRESRHLYNPVDIAFNTKDSLAITQEFDSRLLIVASNRSEFFWGNGSPQAKYNGSYTVASFRSPKALAYMKDGRLLIADTKANRIRMINTANDTISTLIGTGTAGKLDGIATQATLHQPQGLLVDEARKRLYVADTANHLIRVYDFTTNKVSVFAGSKEGYDEGPATQAKFRSPVGLSWGPKQQAIYIADRDNHSIRKLTFKTNGDADTVSTFLGNGTPGSSGGVASQARFRHPSHLRWGPDNKLYISDAGNHLLRIYTP